MKDTYTLITDRIISELESGTIPWHKPWTCAQPAISHTTGKAYSLLNQLLLGGHSGEYSKCSSPTNFEPRKPLRGMKFWKAITMPPMGASWNITSHTNPGRHMSKYGHCPLKLVRRMRFAVLMLHYSLGSAYLSP